MSDQKNEEETLLNEICRKYRIKPEYIKELFLIQKEYADKNISMRRGITEKISNRVLDWAEEEKERHNAI